MKKMLALLLTLCLLAGLLPATALASNTTGCSGGNSCKHEAAIGNTHYDTIGEALRAAGGQSGTGGTVKLLKDTNLLAADQVWDGTSTTYSTVIYKDVILDLGGNTLKCNAYVGISVQSGVHFTIKNGTFENIYDNPWATAIEASKKKDQPVGCTITLEDHVTVKAKYSAVYGVGYTEIEIINSTVEGQYGVYGAGPTNKVKLDHAIVDADVCGVYQGPYDPAHFTNQSIAGSEYKIYNSEITGDSAGVSINNYLGDVATGNHTLLVENSKITGSTGIETRRTDVTIQGDATEITATESTEAMDPESNTVSSGYAVATTYYNEENVMHETATGEQYAAGTLKIEGGNFVGGIGIQEPASGATTAATINITGGTFQEVNGEPYDVSQYLPEGMGQDENGQIIQVVATFDGTDYDTLGAAINAANGTADGGIVTLLKNATLSTKMDADVALVIENGKTLTVNDTQYLASGTLEVKQGGGLKLDNDVLVGSGGTLNLTSGSVTMNGGTVTLTSGSEAEIPNGKTFYLMLGSNGPALNAVIAENAKLTIDGTLKAVSGSGTTGSQVTVKGTLDVKGTLTIALQADVTVESGGTLNLPAMTKETMGSSDAGKGMKGDIIVNSGANLTYAGSAVLGDTSPLLTLTQGTATLNLGNANDATAPTVSLTLNGKASVDGSTKALLVASDNNGTIIPIAISVAGTSEATVSENGVLNLVNGSSLTVEDTAKFEVAGILEVHSTAKFDDKATVSGKVYVFETDGSTNPLNGASITLTNTGAVYAEKTELAGTTITPAQMTDSSEEYTSTSSGVGEKTFAKQWTFSYKPTPPRPTEEKHSITISTDGKGQVTGPASAAEDDTVTLTVKPNADKELYDLKVTGEDGKAIAVTKVNDTTYTFTMPDGKVTIAATFGCDGGDNCPSKAFTDLGDKQWYPRLHRLRRGEWPSGGHQPHHHGAQRHPHPRPAGPDPLQHRGQARRHRRDDLRGRARQRVVLQPDSVGQSERDHQRHQPHHLRAPGEYFPPGFGPHAVPLCRRAQSHR